MLKAICIMLGLCHNITGPAYVIDGDTIVVQEYHIRLFGVDAEEMNEPNGPKAKEIMQYIVGKSSVSCDLTGQKSYNRYVAVCYVNGKDIGQTIIHMGWALDCAHYDAGKYRQDEPVGIRSKLIQKPYC